MNRINTAQALKKASDLTARAARVQAEPAVRKAWGEAGGDASIAARSVKKAVDETRSAWRAGK